MLNIFNLEKLIKRIDKSGNYSLILLLCIAFMHCFYLLFFAWSGIWAMFYFNCFSVPLYALILWLHWRESYSVAGVLTFLEILAHQIAGYFFLGPDAGFDLLLLTLLFSQFSLLPRRSCRVVASVCVMGCAFVSYFAELLGAMWQHSELFYTQPAYASVHAVLYPINLLTIMLFMLVYGVMANVTSSGRIDDLMNIIYKDFLTGLHNRKYLEERAFSAACREEAALFCMADIDDFKRVNDTFGHANGDLVLKFFAMQMQQTQLGAAAQSDARVKVCAARWGGEEFALLITGASCEQAISVLEHLRRALCEHDFAQIGRVSATFGAVWVNAPQKPMCAAYLAAADSALYEGKRSGKNKVVCHDFVPPQRRGGGRSMLTNSFLLALAGDFGHHSLTRGLMIFVIYLRRSHARQNQLACASQKSILERLVFWFQRCNSSCAMRFGGGVRRGVFGGVLAVALLLIAAPAARADLAAGMAKIAAESAAQKAAGKSDSAANPGSAADKSAAQTADAAQKPADASIYIKAQLAAVWAQFLPNLQIKSLALEAKQVPANCELAEQTAPRAKGFVRLRCGRENIFLRYELDAAVQGFRLLRGVARGEALAAAAAPILLPLSAANTQLATEIEPTDVAKSALRAGVVLRRSHVAKARVIAKGDAISITLRDGALEVAQSAVALGSASIGERFRAELANGRKISAIATGAGTAKLP